jgi:hypothetical protein
MHDALVIGHFGFNNTKELVFQDYWWPQLWKYVKKFVGSYDVCVQMKNPCHRSHGFLQPLPIPYAPWSPIFMDFITNLPPFNSFDSILVVVDHLTNMVHFIPCNKSIISERTTKYFLIICLNHGLPKDIISDHGP